VIGGISGDFNAFSADFGTEIYI